MINFVKNGKKIKNYKKCIFLSLFLALIIISVSYLYILNFNTQATQTTQATQVIEEIDEFVGFQVLLPKEDQFKYKGVQLLKYKQKNESFTVSVQGDNLEEINNYNKSFFKDFKISEVNKKNTNYHVKTEGKIPCKVINKAVNMELECCTKDEESFFLENDLLLNEIDLLEYVEKENIREVSVIGEFGNLLFFLQEFSMGQSYADVEFLLESTDKNLYILTFIAYL